jgi:phage terminase small subunit
MTKKEGQQLKGPEQPLSARARRFVEEYLVNLNATQAAARAGYKNPNKLGPLQLVKVGIRAAIGAAMAARSERTELTADAVVTELARIAFSRLDDFATWGPDGVELGDPLPPD